MISNILNALVHFRAEATPATFERIFGPYRCGGLWSFYDISSRRDPVSFYAWLSESEKTLFEAHLSAQLPPACFGDPRCVECGAPLTETDIEAGEDVCLDCAASIVLVEAPSAHPQADRDADGDGVDGDGIEYAPGSLLATVRVRLEGHNLYDSDTPAPDAARDG